MVTRLPQVLAHRSSRDLRSLAGTNHAGQDTVNSESVWRVQLAGRVQLAPEQLPALQRAAAPANPLTCGRTFREPPRYESLTRAYGLFEHFVNAPESPYRMTRMDKILLDDLCDFLTEHFSEVMEVAQAVSALVLEEQTTHRAVKADLAAQDLETIIAQAFSAALTGIQVGIVAAGVRTLLTEEAIAGLAAAAAWGPFVAQVGLAILILQAGVYVTSFSVRLARDVREHRREHAEEDAAHAEAMRGLNLSEGLATFRCRQAAATAGDSHE